MDKKTKLQAAAQLCNEQKFEEAIALYSDMIADEPSHEIYYQRGKAFFFIKSYEKAIADLDRAIVHSGESAHYIGERALSYHMMGDHQAAMADFNLAVEKEPNNAFRYSSRAFVKDRIGDHSGAVKDYQKAIALDPEDAVSYNNLGILLEKMGNKKAAERSFRQADSFDKTKPGTTEAKKLKQNAINNSRPPIPEIKQEKTDPKDTLRKRDVVKSLLTNAKERKEFWQFVRNFFVWNKSGR